MQLRHANITHFRSLREVSVEFGAHTSFIGGNGAGKSSILRAIERFYTTARVLDKDDYFNRDQSTPIEIELTFDQLSDEELLTFGSRVREGRLVVTRLFDTSAASGSYYGSVPQNRDFLPIRLLTGANPKREAYRELKANNPAYAGLPVAGSAGAVDAALTEWEAQHAEALTLERDDGRFFGFQNAGRGALQRHTSFVFVPAVREASLDAADGKSSAIGRLLEILVRSSILKRAEVKSFQEEVASRYKELVSAENMPELGALAGNLTTDLKELYENAAVGLDWREAGEIPIPLPAADVTLSDEGFGGPVDRQGHGLQRAFIFTLLQHLARASMAVSDESEVEVDSIPDEGEVAPEPPAAPNLILAIEEPELYQHPTKQRHLAKVLRRLSSSALPGAAGATQIAFASHSPMFVSLVNADEIRLVRRTPCDDSDLKQCELHALDLSVVARKLEKSAGKPEGTYSAESLKPKLHILGTELAEGFFADGVVLVEGRSDKAALFAVARLLGVDFEAAGIAVLAVEGKSSLDKPYLIFRALGIPVYAIWDCDCGTSKHKKKENLALDRLLRPESEITEPSEVTLIATDHAHFAVQLEACMREELTSAIYEECLATTCGPFGFDPSNDAQKIPDIMFGLFLNAAEKGKTCPTLEGIVKAIWRHLKGVDILPAQPPADDSFVEGAAAPAEITA
jgi:putative ATP-dependent endonuclease of OLD family